MIMVVLLLFLIVGCQPGLPTTTPPSIEQNDTVVSAEDILQDYPDGLDEALEELEMVK